MARIHAARKIPDWHAYALAAVIEESRLVRPNPPLPEYVRDSYLAALRELSDIGMTVLKDVSDPLMVRSILALVAFVKGQTSLGRLALLTEDEQLDMLDN